METAPRYVNMRLFCHNCQLPFNELVNPDNTSGIRCIRCKSEFVEILENGQTYPPDPVFPSPDQSPTRHGRYAPFITNPRVQTHLTSPPGPAPSAPPQPSTQPPRPQPAPPQMRVQIQERPAGFTYIMSGPHGTFQYQVYQTSTAPTRREERKQPRPEEKKEIQPEEKAEEIKEEHKEPRRPWHEQMLSQNLPQYMNMFMSDMQGMNWMGGRDPFSPHFMDGMVFGRGFPHLRLTDFFSQEDETFPTNLGINLQDFGLNFASNFRRGNLIDLVQLISMADAGSTGKPPASKEVVSKLPIFKVEEKHCKKNPDGKMELPNCAVCCSNIELGVEAQLIPCGHMFHPECIKPWFMQHNTCPICRYELPTDDPYYEEIRKRDLEERQEQRSRAGSQQ